MGGGRFDPGDYAAYRSQHVDGKSQSQVFKQTTMHAAVDPKNFKSGMRESVDSADNPRSTPIAIFCDQTGSMGVLAEQIIRTSLGTIVTSLYDRKPVSDPHVLVGAIGDAHNREQAPIQASQFEASALPLLDQLQKLYLERNGGGNGGESYALAHLFASRMTSHDAWNKRREKGFLFTLGDEPIHGTIHSYVKSGVTKDQAKLYMGLDLEADMTAEQIYAEAAERWEIFHIDVKGTEQTTWRHLLGEHFIKLPSLDLLGEVIVSTIQVLSGHDKDDVAKSWGGDKSLVVARAISGLPSKATAGAVARL